MELKDNGTLLVLSAERWNQGIARLACNGTIEIPFLLPALTGHHFFTGIWPPPPNAIDFEPHECSGTLERLSKNSARYHQPAVPHTRVETIADYRIVAPGRVEILFETTSHAKDYPYGYVGLFWGTLVPHGGQRGFHTLAGEGKKLHWLYFAAHGDCDSPNRNTILGPKMPSAEHNEKHPVCYFFAESGKRFALPVQVGRWHGLYYCLEFDNADLAFTNVLMATAVGGPSWDVYWRLEPGQTKRIRCRLTVGKWPGWEQIEDDHREWDGCIANDFVTAGQDHGISQAFSGPEAIERSEDSGLALSTRLFQERAEPLLDNLGLKSKCSVACVGGTSQNAGLDDELSRDHIWGPYLTFLLPEGEFEKHHTELEAALKGMPDEVDGVGWKGYDGPEPRRTGVFEINDFLKMLTGLDAVPGNDRDWLAVINQQSFLGRSWCERLFDATQGAVFHDPGKQFVTCWHHRTGYVPPDIHRALLARSLFRTWNAGSEHNLLRAKERSSKLAYKLCLSRFVNEVMECAFCWNERYIPQFKWRVRQFNRLPMCPLSIRENMSHIAESDGEKAFESVRSIVLSVKMLMKDLYHIESKLDEPLSAFAHVMRARIEDPVIREAASLDW